MEPRFNEPLYNEVPGVTNDIPRPSNSKICAGKEPRCNKTPSQRNYFVSPLALRYIEVPLYNYVIFLSVVLLYSIGFLPVVILNTTHS